MGEAERLRTERDELRAELAALVSAEAALGRRVAAALQRFDGAEAWQGWASCVDYLVSVFGWSPFEARERLRVARALERMPLTGKAWEAGEVSFAKVRKLASLCDAQNEGEFLDLARELPTPELTKALASFEEQVLLGSPEENALDPSAAARRRLAARRLTLKPLKGGLSRVVADVLDEELDLVKKALDVRSEAEQRGADAQEPDTGVGGPLSPAEGRRQRVDRFMNVFRESLSSARSEVDDPVFGRYDVLLHVSPGDLEQGAKASGRSMLQSGVRLSSDAARRLSCAGGRTDVLVKDLESRRSEVLDVGRKHRGPTKALLKALWVRDRGCRFPGCSGWRFVDVHHVRHWADGGPTSLENLVLLCSTHHAYLHEGGYSLQHEAEGVVFRDPDGLVISEGQAPPVRDPVLAQEVEATVARFEHEIANPFDLGAVERRGAAAGALARLDYTQSLPELREHRARDQLDGWRTRRRGGDRGSEGAANGWR